MSLDLLLCFELCAACRSLCDTSLCPKEDAGSNISGCTHNLVPMWREAGVYEALYESHGSSAGDHLDTLRAGLKAMQDEPDRFKKHNPANGWGAYEGAIDVLTAWIAHCAQYPKAKLAVWR